MNHVVIPSGVATIFDVRENEPMKYAAKKAAKKAPAKKKAAAKKK